MLGVGTEVEGHGAVQQSGQQYRPCGSLSELLTELSFNHFSRRRTEGELKTVRLSKSGFLLRTELIFSTRRSQCAADVECQSLFESVVSSPVSLCFIPGYLRTRIDHVVRTVTALSHF